MQFCFAYFNITTVIFLEYNNAKKSKVFFSFILCNRNVLSNFWFFSLLPSSIMPFLFHFFHCCYPSLFNQYYNCLGNLCVFQQLVKAKITIIIIISIITFGWASRCSISSSSRKKKSSLLISYSQWYKCVFHFPL